MCCQSCRRFPGLSLVSSLFIREASGRERAFFFAKIAGVGVEFPARNQPEEQWKAITAAEGNGLTDERTDERASERAFRIGRQRRLRFLRGRARCCSARSTSSRTAVDFVVPWTRSFPGRICWSGIDYDRRNCPTDYSNGDGNGFLRLRTFICRGNPFSATLPGIVGYIEFIERSLRGKRFCYLLDQVRVLGPFVMEAARDE